MSDDCAAAATRGTQDENIGVKTVPSIGETVETYSWLTECLRRDLQRDLESDDQQGSALRNADIDLTSLRIAPNRVLLRSKIKEALMFWQKLGERIPLKRRPAGLGSARLAGSDDMYLDFDIDETSVPLQPPAGASEVHLYQYYVQRIMCAVPRAYNLLHRTAEGPVPLRISRVKAQLDAVRSKRPFGDCYLLKKKNYATKEVRTTKIEDASPPPPPGEGSTTRVAFAATDGDGGGDGSAVSNGAAVTRDGVLSRRGHVFRPATGVEEEETATAEGGEGRANRMTSRTAEASGSGGGGSSGGGGAAAAPSPILSRERILPSFSGPSRAVVTFVLYRSAAKGKGLRLPGHLPEKPLFEVEALEHNTLQEILETMPPCLTDRIMEERREKCCGFSEREDTLPPSNFRQKGMALGGGFVFIRGVFYVTKPTVGEDVSVIPPPPPKVKLSRDRSRLLASEANQAKRAAAELGQEETQTRAKGTAREAARNGPGSLQTRAGDSDAQVQTRIAVSDAEVAVAAPPPEPWMNRWLQVGTSTWDVVKEQLLKQSEEAERRPEQEQLQQLGPEPSAEERASPRPATATATTGSVAAAVSGRHDSVQSATTGRGSEWGEGRQRREAAENEGDEDVNDHGEQENRREEKECGPRGSSLEGDGASATTTRAAPRSARRNTAAGAANASGETRKKSRGKGKGKAQHGGHDREEGCGPAAPAAADTAAATAPRKRKRAEDGGANGGANATISTTPGGDGESKKDKDEPKGLVHSERGMSMKRKLEMDDDGGTVVWASETTVADLRPVLGERYVFLHHRDCDHLFVVSDIRMEPVAAQPNPKTCSPKAAVAVNTGTAAAGRPAAIAKRQEQACEGVQGGARGSSSAATRGAIDAGSVSASGGTGNWSDDGAAAETGDGSGGGGFSAGIGEEVGVTRGGRGEEYPRLSFRSNPKCRRCGICQIMTAVKISVGHPLSDKAPLACCRECFEMLYLDAEQQPLQGQLAGDVSPPPPRGDTASSTPPEGGMAGQVAGGPEGWKVFRCYDEQ